MAKKTTKAATTTTKKKSTKKDSYLKDNYVPINDFNGVVTEVMHIRGIGCIVRERDTNNNAVSSTFVPGVKVKTKKDYKYLIEDKGPKPKKEKKAKAAK